MSKCLYLSMYLTKLNEVLTLMNKTNKKIIYVCLDQITIRQDQLFVQRARPGHFFPHPR